MKRETARWKRRALAAERELAALRAGIACAGAKAMASIHRPVLEDTEKRSTTNRSNAA